MIRFLWQTTKYLGLVLVLALLAFGFYRFRGWQLRRHAQAFLAQARADAVGNRQAEALRNLGVCRDLAPDLVDAYALAARILHRLGRDADADAWMEKLIANNPQKPKAYLERARFLAQTGRPAAAEADLAAALELAPDDREVLLFAMDKAIHDRKDAEARRYADRLLELYPHDVAACGAMADLEIQSGNPSAAISWLERGLETDPARADFGWKLGNLLCDQGRAKEAEQLLPGMEKSDPARAQFLQARIAYAEGRWLKAAQAFGELRERFARQPEVLKRLDYWRGHCYRQMGDLGKQLAIWQEARRIDPGWMPLRKGVIRGLISLGNTDEALEELRQLQKLARTGPEDGLALAQLLILKAIGLEKPKQPWEEVEAILGRIARQSPDCVDVPILRAEVLVAQNRAEAAETLLRGAQARFASHVEVWLALAALAQRQQDFAAAGGWLNQAEGRCGDCVPLRLARASALFGQSGSDAAPQIRRLAENAGQLPAQELPRLWQGLALVSLRAGDRQQVARLCRRMLDGPRSEPALWMLLLEIALHTRDAAGLEQLLGEIQQSEGQAAHWQYGKALHLRLLARQGEKGVLSQAKRHLAEAGSLRPFWPGVSLLAAEIDRMEGDERRAVQNYSAAVESGESDLAAIRDMLEYFWERQRYVEADRIVRRLAARPRTLMIGSEADGAPITVPLDELAGALRTAERSAAKSADRWDRLWWAQVLELAGLRAESEGRTSQSGALLDQAEKVLRELLASSEKSPTSWMSLIQHLARTKQRQKAEEALALARAKLPVDTAPLVLAQAHEILGNRAEAAKIYAAALAAAGEEYLLERLAEGYARVAGEGPWEAQLEKMASSAAKANDRAAAWARRKLAWILVVRGSPPDRQRALQLVEQNLAQSPPSLWDQRMKILLLAASPNRTSRQEAIRFLEAKFAGNWDSAAEEQFLLAQLYLTEDNWSKASSLFRDLLSHRADEPRFWTAFVGALLRKGKLDEAEQRLPWLEKLAPEQFSTLALRAEALFLRGQPEQAVKLLQGFLDRSDAQPRDPAARTDLVAASLQGLARRLAKAGQAEPAAKAAQAAETARRNLLKERPESGIALAMLLAEQGRLDESLIELEKASPHANGEAIADAALRLLAAHPTRPQTERMEKTLLAALARQPRPASLLAATALAATALERYEQAETFWRETLRADARHVAALNNLAIQLALQKRRLDEALELVQRAIEIAGPVPTLLDSRATVYLARGESDKALADLNAAIANAPNPIWYFHKARVLSARKDEAGARDALTKARELGLREELLHPLERGGRTGGWYSHPAKGAMEQ
jgi:tetratricopeptide (TPR) repeat protein